MNRPASSGEADDIATADDESQSGEAEPPRQVKRPTAGGSIMAAAMLGLGEVIEPNKTSVEIEQVADDEPDDLPFKVDFGDLPSLS